MEELENIKEQIAEQLKEELLEQVKQEVESEIEEVRKENGILRRKVTKLTKALTEEEENEEVKNETRDPEIEEIKMREYLRSQNIDPNSVDLDELMSVGYDKIKSNKYIIEGLKAELKKKELEKSATIPDKGGSTIRGFTQAEIDAMSAEEYKKKVLGQN